MAKTMVRKQHLKVFILGLLEVLGRLFAGASIDLLPAFQVV